MRFEDGSGSVSIPEYLEFFSIPHELRNAKTAASAVRMSLDLLELDVQIDEAENLLQSDIDGDVSGAQGLDKGAKRLLLMWTFVQHELEKALVVFQLPLENEQIIATNVFVRTLLELCGKHSPILQAASIDGKVTIKGFAPSNKSSTKEPQLKGKDKVAVSVKEKAPAREKENLRRDPNSNTLSTQGLSVPKEVPIEIEPLERADVELITERFELDGSVHYGHFLAYFTSIHERSVSRKTKDFVSLPDSMIGVSPFRYSTDWAILRTSTTFPRMSSANIGAVTATQSQGTNGRENGGKVFNAPKALVQAKNGKDIRAKSDDTVSKENNKQKAQEDMMEEPVADEAKPDDADDTQKKKDEDSKEEKAGAKEISAVAPKRSMWSFLCGSGAKKPEAVAAPADANADAKEERTKDKDAKGDKGNADDKRSLNTISLDTNDSSLAHLALKRDVGFLTPTSTKAKSKHVQLPSKRENPVDLLHREELGSADKDSKPSSSGSRFRKRSSEQDSPTIPHPKDAMSKQSSTLIQEADTIGDRDYMDVRSKLDDEGDEEGDFESFTAVKVHSNVRTKTMSCRK